MYYANCPPVLILPFFSALHDTSIYPHFTSFLITLSLFLVFFFTPKLSGRIMNNAARAVLCAIGLHRLTETLFKFENAIRFHGRCETSFTPKRKVRLSRYRLQRSSKMPHSVMCGYRIQNLTQIGKNVKKILIQNSLFPQGNPGQ
jgi:hypothetical protein